MKKYFNYFIFICLVFMPFYVNAAGSYSVEMVSGSANNKVIGTYNTYSEALDSMNRQSSNSSVVATIFRNGVPVDSKYAIFKFKPSGNSTFPLYRNASSSSSYTSINTSYVGDAAVLGYSDNGRVKIMVSGFTGWVSSDAGVVTPISLLGANMININGSGVRLRSDHNTSSSIVASLTGSFNFNYTDTYRGSDYTWYKINYNGRVAWAAGGDWVTVFNSNLSTYYNHYGPTGNLIHHFTVYSGGKYTDSFTNLGKAPSYLTKDVYYYSFDGNYFYNSITSMLDDYRAGIYTHSVNSNSPHYSYYLYLTSRSTSGYSASDLDSIVTSNGYNSSSKLYGTGAAFKEAEEVYGTNALLAFSAAINESAWGTSAIARAKNNLFGYGASDSCPYDCAYSYNSPRDSIMDYASKSSVSYETASGKYYYGSHYGNKSSGKNIMYATDPYWGEKMAGNAYTRDLKFGGKDFNSNTIGVTKKGVSNVVVYRDASTNSPLYTMKNSRSGDPVYDFTANIVDKVSNNGVDFYKIYTDLSKDQEKFGYVLASQFNVSNSQPVINAKDLEIKVGDKFDYLNGVTVSDKENGDLTNRVTYEGVVDTSKEGVYSVTYSACDNSNFHVSKKINVKVINNDEVKIEASDKEVLQYSEFDYLDGVKAYNSKGIVDVTYEGVVDTSKVGEYSIIYKASNVSKKVIIKVIKNEKPVIEAKDMTINVNDEFDYLAGVTASDKEDGGLEVSYEGVVDTSKAGKYNVKYTASDKEGQKVSKGVTISVVDSNENNNTSSEDISTPVNPEPSDIIDSENEILEKRAGEFYLQKFEFDKEFSMEGYLIQKGISNSISDSIKFYVVFKNVDNSGKYKIQIDRWVKDYPYDLSENIDYTGAWFKGSVDVSKLPAGDYDVYMRSENGKYYSEEILNNIMNRPFSHRGIIDNRSFTFRVNQKIKSKAVQLYVRDNVITSSESPTFRNMINDYESISFNNGKLNVSGISYNYGGNYSDPSKISRQIIFENLNNYKQYYFDLGSTNEGSYRVTSLDGLSKDYAWFNKEIDVSNLPSGTYSLIIRTKSYNVDDYGYLVDMFSSVNNEYKYSSKSYKFSVNKIRDKRIELTIK